MMRAALLYLACITLAAACRSPLIMGAGGGIVDEMKACHEAGSKHACMHTPHCSWCSSSALPSGCFHYSESMVLPKMVYSCSVEDLAALNAAADPCEVSRSLVQLTAQRAPPSPISSVYEQCHDLWPLYVTQQGAYHAVGSCHLCCGWVYAAAPHPVPHARPADVCRARTRPHVMPQPNACGARALRCPAPASPL